MKLYTYKIAVGTERFAMSIFVQCTEDHSCSQPETTSLSRKLCQVHSGYMASFLDS